MLKWRANRKVSFNQWQNCTRCYLPWPKRAYRRQRGLELCPECIDDKDHEQYKAEGEMKDPRGPQTAPWNPD